MKEIKKPFLGAAYYPEDWPEAEIDKDIAMMVESGMDVVRIGEFAWARMEPNEGEYDFTWLHNVVDKLGDAGIGVIMGTPTAVPPYWLTAKDPEMFIEGHLGYRVQHGGRRHACSNNPIYLEYCDKIVTALAKEFGDDENIIGWQIDNEMYILHCHCKHCLNKFHQHLKSKFGSVDELNRRWNLNLFSSKYRSIEEIQFPRVGIANNWVNPQHFYEYISFDANVQIGFVARQAKILKKYVKAPIGTDQMPFNDINYRDMHRPLDVIQFNHYNTPDNLWECGLWMDYLRTMKDTPFWNTETATCWSGATGAAGSIKPDGFCYANSWLPIVLGGEANLYWLWRTHWAGHELMHGSVLESSGRPQYSINEVKQLSKDFKKASEFVSGTKVSTEVALHFTSESWRLFQTQSIVNDFVYDENLKKYFYKPLIDSGIRPDVIDAEQELDKYKVVFTPMIPNLEERDLNKRIADWVRNGGIWITGPMTDIRNPDSTKYIDRLHGSLEEFTNAYCRYWVPDVEKRLKNEWSDGSEFGGNFYYELFDSVEGADVVKVTGGSKAVEGLAVIQKYNIGKGTVYILGTLPDYEDMRRLITEVCGQAGVPCDLTEGNSIMVSVRKGDKKNGVMLAEVAGKGGIYHNSTSLTDILTGNSYTGDIVLEPYEVMVLEE